MKIYNLNELAVWFCYLMKIKDFSEIAAIVFNVKNSQWKVQIIFSSDLEKSIFFNAKKSLR